MDRWLVAYDIPDDQRRTRVAGALEGQGDRVQYSVFEILTDPRALERLLERLRAILDPQQDRLRLYPLCAACSKKVISLCGQEQEPWWEPEVWIV